MGLSQWLTDQRNYFVKGFRRFQRSSNPLSQAMNTGIDVLMNNTGVGNAIGLGLQAANSALDTVNKMNQVETTTGLSPAQQATMLGTEKPQ